MKDDSILRPNPAPCHFARPCMHTVVDTSGTHSCGKPGQGVGYDLRPWGRGVLVASCCEEHGGLEAADDLLLEQWMMRAPVSVGDSADVRIAGWLTLTSVDTDITLERDPGGWRAYLGLGKAAVPVRMLARLDDEPRFVARSRDTALALAVIAWAQRVRDDVKAIRAARGGAIDWGDPVDAVSCPNVVVRPEQPTRFTPSCTNAG